MTSSTGVRRPVVRNQRAWMLTIGATILSILLVALAIFFLAPVPHAEPSAFAPIEISLVDGGSAGCRATPGNICYLAEVQSSLTGVPVSNLFFAVNGSGAITYPMTRSVPLGSGATVSILNGSTIAGAWNYTTGSWSTAPAGYLSTVAPIVVVLDTGLTSNSTFAGSSFYIEHSMPYGGLVGFPL
jgi:hypothetical protein